MPNRTKVLYVVTQSEFGGAQRYVLDLASNLPKDQYETAIACGEDATVQVGDDLIARARKRGIRTHVLASVGRAINPLRDSAGFFELFALLRTERPDVVHLNSSKVGILGGLAAKMTRVPKTVFTAHGLVFHEPLPHWQKMFYRLLEQLARPFRDAIITVSNADRESAIGERLARPERIVHIPNGIGTLEFLDRTAARGALEQKVGHALPERTIGTIANFYPTKGLPYLLAALFEVRRTHPDIAGVIIGDGSQRPHLESLIERNKLADTVILAGALPNATQYLKAFDLFVLPSVKEGWPYVILEAMAAEVPIVATRVGGIPEMLSPDGGPLVPTANPAALAGAIAHALAHPAETAATAKRTQEIVRRDFTLERMVRETTAVYRG
ncbi:glycosyltransferase [Candidatus Parcubacteria bacterium]|nr:glycosyltransferase [Candidatus Parcubacteria bacterium]